MNNSFYFSLGWLILALNKIRHTVQGYATPRDFPTTDFQTAIDYDFRVVNNWLDFLQQYSPAHADIKNKIILELGPGADLGAGLILLMHGAKKYQALDVNNLVKTTPQKFYQELFKKIEQQPDKVAAVDYLREQLDAFLRADNHQLDYICDPNFNPAIFANDPADLIVSQAAFEHFDDPAKTMAALNQAAKPGAILITEIDLATHTRWLRDHDPLNIYRYSDAAYNRLRFAGSPNRLRPLDYEKILAANGWRDIQIHPLSIAPENYLTAVQPALAPRFQTTDSQMHYLSILIGARKG